MHRLDQITMTSIPRAKDTGAYLQDQGSTEYSELNLMATNQTADSRFELENEPARLPPQHMRSRSSSMQP
jgi:hypothetical protein